MSIEQKTNLVGVFLSLVTTVAAAGIISLVSITYRLEGSFNEFKIEQAYWQGTVDARLQNLTDKVDSHLDKHGQDGSK